MRPKIINDSMLQEMRSLRSSGVAFREIADKFGVSPMAAYYNLGGKRAPLRTNPPPAANDNKIVKMMPHNGGCSTTSGEQPVSLRRIPTMETAEVAPSEREMRVADLRVAA
ncbi:hypothetical protein [Rhizobium sp. S9]|uniref:hypothetical protein n=1 Tax=Rhizobium sp. S9 TaxID=2035454 RepID=UPI001AEF6252|nr:hypothetical protein [Rhizobium sp. S9]